MVTEWSATSGELTIWASTQTPHELRAFAARLLGIPAQHVRVIMRDTGGGFGQKVVPMREDMHHAGRAQGADRTEVDRGPPREPDVGRSVPLTSTAMCAWHSTTTATSWPPTSTSSRTSARPDALPVLTTAAIGMFFPGPYRVPKARLQLQDGVLQHRGPACLSRPVAVRNPHARKYFSTSPPARWTWTRWI